MSGIPVQQKLALSAELDEVLLYWGTLVYLVAVYNNLVLILN